MFETISCIVPARNEAGHLSELIDSILTVLQISEIVIVEGGSHDNTWEVAQEIVALNPSKVKLVRQENKGKFDAVLKGSHYCSNAFLMIWDADGTVPLTDTQNLISYAIQNQEPVMGDRLRGKIHPGAMRPANWLGNWFFAILWAPILGKKPADLLCGTKIFPRKILVEMPNWLVDMDPYGDFAMIFNARLNSYPITSIPVNYTARSYGATNISRWSGGISLLKTSIRAYLHLIKRRLKFKK